MQARRSSPLHRELVDGRLAASVRSFYVPTRDPFLYSFGATPAEGVSLEPVERRLFRILDRARSKRPCARELRKAKNQIRAAHVFQSDSVTEVAHNLGYFETICGHRFLAEFLDRIEEVTAEEVRDVAERILRPANRTVGSYVPSRNGRRPS